MVKEKILRDAAGQVPADSPLAETQAELDSLATKDTEDLLRESERRSNDLFTRAPIGIWVCDFSAVKKHVDEMRAQGVVDLEEFCDTHPDEALACVRNMRVVDVNPAALELYGAASPEELIQPRPGQPSEDEIRSARLSIMAIAQGQTETTYETQARKIDGDVMDLLIRWRVAAGHEEDYAGVFMFAVDITNIRQSMEEVERYESRFRAIYDNTPLGIRLYRLHDDGRLIFEAYNTSADKLLGIDHATRVNMEIEKAFPMIVGTELPVRLREVATTGVSWSTQQFAYQDNEISGIFDVRAFRAEPNTVAVMFENITARRQQEEQLAAYRTELERMVEERTRELLRASAERDAVTSIAVRLVEARDPYTAGHQRRVAELVGELCLELGLDESEAADVTIAARLHDIGKVSIPSDILSKPAALTETEYRLVQEHPETAYQILESANMGGSIARIVREHHERMDGSGYPRGLQGDEICLGARIIGVADVVEAMASHRPYRASKGIDVALAEIEQFRGTFYDTDVVRCCVGLFRDGFEFSDLD
jgi:PAS domain S-box-containing protein